jgi:hypothetical protein
VSQSVSRRRQSSSKKTVVDFRKENNKTRSKQVIDHPPPRRPFCTLENGTNLLTQVLVLGYTRLNLVESVLEGTVHGRFLGTL